MEELSGTGFRGDSRYEDAGYPGDITSIQLECLIEGARSRKRSACPSEPFSLSPSPGVKGQKGNAVAAAPTGWGRG